VKADLLQGFYLGDLLVEPLKGQVTGRAGSQHLPPKAVEVLVCLAEAPGDLVTRDQLLDEVWGVGHGSQEALSHAVSEIRHALDDHPDNPTFVQTLPKRGYRLLIEPVLADENTASVVIGAHNGISVAEIGLFENLKQRGVLETAVAYLIVGWLLIQIADIVFDQIFLPDWAGTFVTFLVIAGFPIAIVMSWYLEFRNGRAVVHLLSPADARKRRFSQTYVSVVAALALASLLVFVYDRSIGLPEADIDTEVQLGKLPPIVENSFAVLPFLNLDGSDETEVFARGLVDDVINSLARVPGLRVSSRGDSFTLEPNTSSQKVRERLRVEMFLEGSVEMSGDEIRVIVQLIDSETGFHEFSRSFDRPREDFFDIRDEITSLTVSNVRVALPPGTRTSKLQSNDRPTLDVYQLYRRGVDASHLPMSIETVNTALNWYVEALALDPDYAAAHAGKCEIYVFGYAQTNDASFIDEAESSCATALRLNPNLDVVHTSLGRLYLSTGAVTDAEAAFRRALEIDPSSADSFVGLGHVYLRQNLPEQAESNFRLAVGLHPGDWSAYNQSGNFLYRSGRYAEAVSQYEYVIALNPDNMNGYSNLGAAHMLAGNFTAAAAAYERALEIEPTKIAHSNLGLLFYYVGDFDRSIENHRRAIELAPNDYLAKSNIGDAYAADGQSAKSRNAFTQAQELAEDALAVDSNDPWTTMDLAWIDSMLDEQENARKLIDKALELLPEDPYTHYYDGLIWLREGDKEAALAALGIAAELGYSRQIMAAEPHFAQLHDDTRFLRLLED
jgi:tetratricopeptide (TPR) repeat protein/TolB-like protein/DNA-binding winged helix-turn-helix (wHTH) protein